MDNMVEADEAFCAEVWEALTGDHNNLRKQALILQAHRAAIPVILEQAAKECERQREDFLSPQYAVGQPLSSLMERFACDQCAQAIRALGEQSNAG